MEKVALQTADIAAENAAKLGELFPDIVTEVLDEDGNVRYGIDVEALKAHVGDIAEGKRERYQFTWPGKQRARAEAIRQIDKTMRPAPEESVNWDTTENLYIEGDNLDALKILRETYAGKIKMIYIDPPYNTGHDFVYNDSFARTAGEERAESGAFDEEGNVFDAAYKVNNESNGRFHSDWCSMMYPRLMLARDLLSDDGILFLSIDDVEVGNARRILDECFGSGSFVTKFCWEKTQHFGRQKKNFYSNVDYILCYQKSAKMDGVRELLVERVKTELEDAPLYNASNGESVLAFPVGCVKFNMPDGVYSQTTSGDYQLFDPVVVSGGLNENEFRLKFKSRWSPSTVLREIEKGTTFWVKTTKFAIRAIYGEGRRSLESPKQIIFTNQQNPGCTYSRFEIKVGTSESASAEVDNLVGDAFSYPKPVSLISYFASLLWSEADSNHLSDFTVLDFFSGSATTAHAVMQLNAEDGGNRKFIMVQLPEVCDEKSEAAKAGYKNICEIGKERIRRAGAKIAAEVEESNAQLKPGEEPKKVSDVGFRVLKIDSSNFEDVQRTPDAVQQDQLFGFADNLKSDRTPEDILFQLLPKFQIPYTARIEKLNICGKTVYSVDDDALLACFDRDVPEDAIRIMAARQPLRAVLRDASFVGDDALANFEEIFKTLSPETETKVV